LDIFRLFIQAKDGGTLLRKDVWNEIMELNEIVHNVTIVFDEDSYNYDSLCANWEGECAENDILEIGELLDDVIAGKMPINYPIMFNPNTYKTYALPIFFGGVKLTDKATVSLVKALQLNYFIAVNSDKQDRR